jgi:tetratricopeptide (TPR) repeat protein
MSRSDNTRQAVGALLDRADELDTAGEYGAAAETAQGALDIAVTLPSADGELESMIRLMIYECKRHDSRRLFLWAARALALFRDPQRRAEVAAMPAHRRANIMGGSVVFLARAVTTLGQGTVREALRMLDELSQDLEKGFPPLLVARAIVLGESGRVKEAIPEAEEAVARTSGLVFPCRACAQTLLARLHHRAGDPAAAYAVLDATTHGCESSKIQRLVLRARLALDAGDLGPAKIEAKNAVDEAAHAAADALSLDPIDPRVNALAISVAVHRAAGERDAARREAQKVLAMNPTEIGPLSRWRALSVALDVAFDDRDPARATSLVLEAEQVAITLDHQREDAQCAAAVRAHRARLAEIAGAP